MIASVFLLNSKFISNTVGPILSKEQLRKVTSSLYINNAYTSIVEGCSFTNHSEGEYYSSVKIQSPYYFNFMPPSMLNLTQAAIISILKTPLKISKIKVL
jgi:hypothetical protein